MHMPGISGSFAAEPPVQLATQPSTKVSMNGVEPPQPQLPLLYTIPAGQMLMHWPDA
jgi:hypothetical protein